MIDMPSVQGTLFIDNCFNDITCFGTQAEITQLYLASTLTSAGNFTAPTEAQLKLFMPWQHVLIEENYFYNNWANVIMDAQQTQKQASSLYIRQGLNN